MFGCLSSYTLIKLCSDFVVSFGQLFFMPNKRCGYCLLVLNFFLCIDKEWKEITSFVSLQVLNHTIYLTRKAKWIGKWILNQLLDVWLKKEFWFVIGEWLIGLWVLSSLFFHPITCKAFGSGDIWEVLWLGAHSMRFIC